MLANRDLIVAVDISRAPILDGKEQDMQSPRLSYWQEILPQQVPEVGFGQHLIVVHTADHARRVPGSSGAHQAGANGNAFCGWDKPISLIRLELSPEYLRRVDAALGSMPSQSQAVNVLHTRDPKILQMGVWLLDELHHEGMGAQLYADSLAKALALHIMRQRRMATVESGYFGPSEPLRSEVASAIEYMQAYLSQPISLDDLSQAAHLSPSHLERLFKRSTGMTPHQFLIRLRVDHARELLLSNRLAIPEVASQSGFADQSHLNRHMKRVYGVTPNAILNKSYKG